MITHGAPHVLLLSSLLFFGRARVQGQRMDIGLHQIAQGRIDKAMARQQRHWPENTAATMRTRKCPAAIARTGVAGMLVAFVFDRSSLGANWATRHSRMRSMRVSLTAGSCGRDAR